MSLLDAPPTESLRRARTSVKWTRFPDDVLPLTVAEMDYAVAASVETAIVDRVRAGDLGYIDGPGELPRVFAEFARERWGWTPDVTTTAVATDVSVGIVEAFRVGIPEGSDVVITPPVYPPFYELIDEARCHAVEVPLVDAVEGWTIDLDALEAAFANGAAAFLLCHPHNPLGLVHSEATLVRVAELAAQYDVLVISDEVHAPLTHNGVRFVPFLQAAGGTGAKALCVTSASKAWNIAGTKCALVLAGDPFTAELLTRLPDEVAARTSILGLHANIAAFRETTWLDDTIQSVEANDALLHELLAESLPAVKYHRPRAGYLGWLDFRGLGWGDEPAARLLSDARVALNAGHTFGDAGRGFARINLACSPETLREAVRRIAASAAAR